MIKYIDGNILSSSADIIVHQVNCQGVMGSGIARQIRSFCPKHYIDYKFVCDNIASKNDMLGHFVLTPYDINSRLYICGIFGQFNYGRDGICYTNYPAVKKAMASLKSLIDIATRKDTYRIAMPYKMCCGLAGGDWDIIMSIMYELFGKSKKITLEIWKL